MEFQEVLDSIETGTHFSIDLNKRLCKVGKKVLIDEVWNGFEIDNENILETLQKEYDEFRFSKPSERSSQYERHSYFSALSDSELTDRQLLLGTNREVARFKLELTMLYIVMNYKWHELFNPRQYFYRGQNGLRVYKDWFNKEN